MDSTTNSNVPDLYDAEIFQLQEGLRSGRFTSVQLVEAYIDRINEVNDKGPRLRAVLEVNAAAVQQAKQLDEQRRAALSKGRTLPLLHGIPILLMDNIATRSPDGFEECLETTAGSFALLGCLPPQDATVTQKLRKAGAIILGKANMSEWAHWRGKVPSGWSPRGGQCTNPYYPGADPSGSSSGCAVAAAIGLAAGTLATETDGSISGPSSLCNVVGIKPTVGLTSRSGVIPVSKHFDSVGPICRTVSDAAIMLQAISGRDKTDPLTSQLPSVPDYTSALSLDFLTKKRIGVLRGCYNDRLAWKMDDSEEAYEARLEAFEDVLKVLKELGAEVLDCVDIATAEELFENREKEKAVFRADFKNGLNDYLAKLPQRPTGVQSLADVIEFNRTHKESYYMGQENQIKLTESEATTGGAQCKDIVNWLQLKSREEGIDACLKEHSLDLLIAPWSLRTSYVSGVAGYPILTLPLGFLPETTTPFRRDSNAPYLSAPGLPFGIVFMGTAWSERTLIGCAYALEQKLKMRSKRKAYAAAIPRTQIHATPIAPERGKHSVAWSLPMNLNDFIQN